MKTGLIGFVLPYDYNLNGMGECVKGINEILNSKNCYLSIYCSERSVIREAEILRELAEMELDGVICLPCSSFENVEIFNYYGMIGKPILFIDLYSESLPISAVVSDNRSGSRALCDRLFERGHTRIGYFAHGSISDLSSLKDRYLGYVDSLKTHKRSVNLDYIEINIKERAKYENALNNREISYNKEGFGSGREYENKMYELYLEEKLRRLINLGVTAIMCENDWIALEVLSVCRNIGVTIPTQLEIAGFDNIPELMGVQSGQYILTAEQNYREIGRKAGKLILDQTMPGHPAAAEIHYVPVRPVLRDTEERQAAENT